MSLAMYEEQRRHLEKLFREHALQQAEEAARQQFLAEKYQRDRLFAYTNWYPPNPAPVMFARHANVPTISTRPYTMHTPAEIAVLKREYAAMAEHQAAAEFEHNRMAMGAAHHQAHQAHQAHHHMKY